MCETRPAGYNDYVLIAVAVAFPFFMLSALLMMEWVERPLRVDEVGMQLEKFFDAARPDELETFVSEGYAPALDRYWKRRHQTAA
jgi:hypothetical protein